MSRRLIPLLTEIGLLVWLVGVFIYIGTHVTGSAVARVTIVAVPLILCIIGVWAAWSVRNNRVAQVMHTIAAVLVIVGVLSFTVLTEPTTINFFGGVAILLGILLGVVASFFFVRITPRR